MTRLLHPRRAIETIRRAGAVVIAAGLTTAMLTVAAITPAHATSEPATSATTEAGEPTVLISELANAGRGSRSDSFFELANFGDEPVDLSGWHVYRCSMQGLRANPGRVEADLYGVVLDPGERFTAARAGTALSEGRLADALFSQAFADVGFGLLLTDATGAVADSVGVYPNLPWPTTSECTVGRNLPNTLAGTLGESWQRVATTGDVRRDFVRAPATAGSPNVDSETMAEPANVRIAEIAAAGPGSSGEEFVELERIGDAEVDLDGWRLLTCDAAGRVHADRHETRLHGTLRAQERLVIAHHDARLIDDDEPRARVIRSALGLAARGHGVLLVDDAGRRVDGIGVSAYDDSACQTGDTKLPVDVDARAGESWQLTGDGAGEADWVVAPRTPGARNAAVEQGLRDAEFAYPPTPEVAISELATDPGGLPDGVERRNFVELANYGDESVDLSGWRVLRCTRNGPRMLGDALEIGAGTRLEPGRTWTAALVGTPAARDADATLAEAFDFRGTGAWIEEARGRRIDSVGVYLANEMDFSLERPSPCTKGMSLTTFAPDRVRGETYQRTAFTGVDADDFTIARATPGTGGMHDVPDPVATALADARADLVRTVAAEARERERDAVTLVGSESPADPTGDPLPIELAAAFAGSADAPLVERHGLKESSIDVVGDLRAADDGYLLPYLRLEATVVARDAVSVTWHGHARPGGAVRLSAWNPADAAWRALDETSALPDGTLALSGALTTDEVDDAGRVELLVQAVPRATTSLEHAESGGFDAASAYDFAISHITDTQYLAEAYPETYAEVVGWIATNAEHREIAFATHTGDLVQNWVDPDQHEALARREFEVASRMQAVLDDAGVPNSVLPGNHDNKRGISNALYNEYFGPSRYAAAEWYGGSIAPGDNSANFSTFERAGARFLMLSLPYAYGEREIAWAEQVVVDHPGHNVVVSTHEHLTPKLRTEPARRSTSSRWVSRGAELWERVIAPNRNVVAVLSGHFHGLGRIVTEDAGGIPGHTVVELLADYQEFRTHEGARATGFQRLLQLDLAGGAVAVDTHSVGLDAHASHPYDYVQFDPERGDDDGASEMRPWNILERGVQHRYTAADDEFVVAGVAFQYAKEVAMVSLSAFSSRADTAPQAPSVGGGR